MTNEEILKDIKQIYVGLFNMAEFGDSKTHAACVAGACDIVKAKIIAESNKKPVDIDEELKKIGRAFKNKDFVKDYDRAEDEKFDTY